MTDKPSDRQEFEAAFPQLDHRDYLAEGAACYIDPKTQGAWEGWMARGRRIAAAPEGAQAVAYIEQYRLNGETQMQLVWDDGERDDREYVPLFRSPPSLGGEDAASWIDRAAFCANELLATALHRVKPVRNEDGSSLNHCRWMAEELAAKRVGSETKACRWLGYLQGQLIAWCMSTLECEKDRNQRSAAARAAEWDE